MAKFVNVPANVGAFDQQGVDVAVDSLIRDPAARKATVAALSSDPGSVARQMFRLNETQIATLRSMSDAEMKKLVQPVIDGLTSPRVRSMRVALTQVAQPGGGSNTAGDGEAVTLLRVRCRLEIEF